MFAALAHGRGEWWQIVVLLLFALAGIVFFIRSATSYIVVEGGQLRARGQATKPVQVPVSDVKGLFLTNETAIFGMTRPWPLEAQLTAGRATLNGDMKRFAWLDVFRLAAALGVPCHGPAMPGAALQACNARHQAPERGTLDQVDGWSLLQRLRRDRVTGNLTLMGPASSTSIYLIKGRTLRLEESWPREVSADSLRPYNRYYVVERSALSETELDLVVRALEDKWLGTRTV